MTTRTLPELDDVNRAFWTSGADERLRIQRCGACDRWQHPPTVACPGCGSDRLCYEAVSGWGTIEAYTVNHQAWRPGLVCPYGIAIVGLDEMSGLRLTTEIVGLPLDKIQIGQRVHAVFEQIEDVWLPRFEVAPGPIVENVGKLID